MPLPWSIPRPRCNCVSVHMVRNSLRYVSWKDYKAVTAELKQIDQSATEREAQQALGCVLKVMKI